MSDEALEIAVMLIQHRARPTGSPYCICGWRPALMLNDTEADRGQHIAHQAEMIDEMQRRKHGQEAGAQESQEGREGDSD